MAEEAKELRLRPSDGSGDARGGRERRRGGRERRRGGRERGLDEEEKEEEEGGGSPKALTNGEAKAGGGRRGETGTIAGTGRLLVGEGGGRGGGEGK